MNPPEVIVGIDGSPASRGAVQWAAAEAARRDIELVVVHAYEWRVVGARAQVGGAISDDARNHAQELVDAAVADAREFAPTVKVRGEAVEGSAGHVLVGASRRGGIVVVGSRGRGGFASLLLGSVSQQVATHAHGPVVVVRGRGAESTGPVVVGTDGSDAARYAVGIAFAEAAVRGAQLFAIRTYQPANPPWTYGVPPYVEDWEQRREAERAALAEDIAPWVEKFPDVGVQMIVVDGHAADSLVRHSADAQLVVVGTRGHGGFTGLLLGSVGLQLLHHADGPVLIARQPEQAQV